MYHVRFDMILIVILTKKNSLLLLFQSQNCIKLYCFRNLLSTTWCTTTPAPDLLSGLWMQSLILDEMHLHAWGWVFGMSHGPLHFLSSSLALANLVLTNRTILTMCSGIFQSCRYCWGNKIESNTLSDFNKFNPLAGPWFGSRTTAFSCIPFQSCHKPIYEWTNWSYSGWFFSWMQCWNFS